MFMYCVSNMSSKCALGEFAYTWPFNISPNFSITSSRTCIVQVFYQVCTSTLGCSECPLNIVVGVLHDIVAMQQVALTCACLFYEIDLVLSFLYSACYGEYEEKPPKHTWWLDWRSMYASWICLDWSYMWWRTKYTCHFIVSSTHDPSIYTMQFFYPLQVCSNNSLYWSTPGTFQVWVSPDLCHLTLQIWLLLLICKFYL